MDGEDNGHVGGTWTDEHETAAFGRALAKHAEPGDVVALVGELGTGKTTLARYIAEALAVDVSAEFSSPTYCYANEYRGRLPVVHMDFYRVVDQDMAEALGLIELSARQDALLLIEWANKLPECLPPHAVWLSLAPPDGVLENMAQAASQAALAARVWQARGPKATLLRLFGDESQKRAPHDPS